MVQLPENQVTQADLELWYQLDEQLSKLKAQELILRNKIYKGLFVTHDEQGHEVLPKEGTNQHPLADGYVLKAQRVINRQVDAAALDTLKKERNELREKVKAGTATQAEVNRYELLKRLGFDDLVKLKPELAVKEYRTLTDEERLVFEECLIIKDGTPQLEIMLPKRRT